MSYFTDRAVTMVEQVVEQDGVLCDSCGLKVVVDPPSSPPSSHVQPELVGWGRWAVIEPDGSVSRSIGKRKDLCPPCAGTVVLYIRDMKLARER
jgi:hypothetical protein